MKLEELLQHENFLDGLESIYKEYNLLEKEEEFSLEGVDEEERQTRLKYNVIREKYGWSFSDLWDLDESLFKFLLPRLYVFYKEDAARNHLYNDDGRWDEIVEAILEMILLNLDNDGRAFTKEENTIHITGMTLLTRYIKRLWI